MQTEKVLGVLLAVVGFVLLLVASVRAASNAVNFGSGYRDPTGCFNYDDATHTLILCNAVSLATATATNTPTVTPTATTTNTPTPTPTRTPTNTPTP